MDGMGEGVIMLSEKNKARLRKTNIACFCSHEESKFKSACAYVVAGMGWCRKVTMKEEEVLRQKEGNKARQ